MFQNWSSDLELKAQRRKLLKTLRPEDTTSTPVREKSTRRISQNGSITPASSPSSKNLIGSPRGSKVLMGSPSRARLLSNGSTKLKRPLDKNFDFSQRLNPPKPKTVNKKAVNTASGMIPSSIPSVFAKSTKKSDKWEHRNNLFKSETPSETPSSNPDVRFSKTSKNSTTSRSSVSHNTGGSTSQISKTASSKTSHKTASSNKSSASLSKSKKRSYKFSAANYNKARMQAPQDRYNKSYTKSTSSIISSKYNESSLADVGDDAAEVFDNTPTVYTRPVEMHLQFMKQVCLVKFEKFLRSSYDTTAKKIEEEDSLLRAVMYETDCRMKLLSPKKQSRNILNLNQNPLLKKPKSKNNRLKLENKSEIVPLGFENCSGNTTENETSTENLPESAESAILHRSSPTNSNSSSHSPSAHGIDLEYNPWETEDSDDPFSNIEQNFCITDEKKIEQVQCG